MKNRYNSWIKAHCVFGGGVYIKIILYGPGMATDRKDRGLRPKERKAI